MLILGISGRKQSGKSTTGNFVYSIYLSNLSITDKVFIDDSGQIIVTDLLGDKNYAGRFDPSNNITNDYILSNVFKKLDPIIRIYNFADILKKDICMNILGLTYQQCYGSDQEKNTLTNLLINNKPSSAREILQYIGTDIFRNIKSDVWVEATINKIKQDNPKIAIITDCRFPNEVEIIRNNGGKIIRLTRDPHHSNHISESILDRDKYDWSNFDYIIDNQDLSLIDQLSHTQNILQEIIQL